MNNDLFEYRDDKPNVLNRAVECKRRAMAILIKGMDKETAMRLCSYAGIWMEEEDFIEIPPHGRLIDADEAIEELPTAEPEIIKCKECLMHGVCRFEQGLGLDGYCSQAERRTDG